MNFSLHLSYLSCLCLPPVWSPKILVWIHCQYLMLMLNFSNSGSCSGVRGTKMSCLLSDMSSMSSQSGINIITLWFLYCQCFKGFLKSSCCPYAVFVWQLSRSWQASPVHPLVSGALLEIWILVGECQKVMGEICPGLLLACWRVEVENYTHCCHGQSKMLLLVLKILLDQQWKGHTTTLNITVNIERMNVIYIQIIWASFTHQSFVFIW